MTWRKAYSAKACIVIAGLEERSRGLLPGGMEMEGLSAAIHTVLVIVPNMELRRSIEFALEAEGYALRAFASIAEALETPAVEASCAVIDEDAFATGSSTDSRSMGFKLPVILLADRLGINARTPHARIVMKPLLGGQLTEAVFLTVANRQRAACGRDDNGACTGLV